MKRALLVLAACGGGHARPPISASATSTIAGVRIDQIVELGDTVYLFEPDRIAVVRNGSVIASTAHPDPCAAHRKLGEPCPSAWPNLHEWTSATSIPALDGDGRWVVATRSDGTLLRILSSGESEPIGDRLGLGNARVRSIVATGSTIAARLDDATAITTDGVHLRRFPITGELAIGRDRLAIATDHAIEVWDLVRSTRVDLAIEYAHPGFIGDRLIATTDHGLWLEDHGTLVPVRIPAGRFSATVAGARLWVLAGDALYTLDRDHLRQTTAPTAAAAVVIGSPTGDLWVNAHGHVGQQTFGWVEGGALTRYSLDHATADPRWTAEVAPVFQRVCAHCHLPGGDADVDLSTPASWATERAEITRRVLVTRTMPPAGTELSDADRSALAGWLAR